jgi:methionyl-tRNA formyltransferase
MDIVYFGSGAFGIPSLERLVRDHRVRAVVTQPDRPVGRGKVITPTPIGQAIASMDSAIPVYKPERINQAEIRDEIRAIGADAWVVIAYGQKLGQKLLADKFAMNLHASLLPRWRGAAPINAAIVAGDSETGSCVITLVDEMDAGDVLASSTRVIQPNDTFGELHDLLAVDGVVPLFDALAKLEAGTLKPEIQDSSCVTLAPKLSKKDTKINFGWDATRCRNLIHGYNPWPSVTVTLGELSIKLHRAEVIPDKSVTKPGTIVDADQGIVSCGEGCIRLIEVQPAGKKPMSWVDFSRGRSVQTGAVIVQ